MNLFHLLIKTAHRRCLEMHIKCLPVNVLRMFKYHAVKLNQKFISNYFQYIMKCYIHLCYVIFYISVYIKKKLEAKLIIHLLNLTLHYEQPPMKSSSSLRK